MRVRDLKLSLKLGLKDEGQGFQVELKVGFERSSQN